jgi:hypothetical protein
MRTRKTRNQRIGIDAVLSATQREREQKAAGYRDRALKLFPHVCGRCGREFSGRRLKELTVHHKDHNHENNPLDGSNWELLCIYCHDMEHAHDLQAEGDDGSRAGAAAPFPNNRPFAALKDLLKDKG